MDSVLSTTLCIGDGHVTPEDKDDRWVALGWFISKLQPDSIVQIGDFMTYDSISAWNKSKRLSMEGQRLRAELEAGRNAYDDLMNPIHQLNESNRRNRKAQYKPNMFWLEGNHEERALRYAEENPEMLGMVDYKAWFNPEDDGWNVVPYRQHCEIDGVMFTHVPMNGNNQPIGSKHSVKNVIKDYTNPIVYGHSHKLAYECDGVRTTAGGRRLTALNAGCFFLGVPDYASGSSGPNDWWAGVCLLHHLNEHGDYDLETISMERLLSA